MRYFVSQQLQSQLRDNQAFEQLAQLDWGAVLECVQSLFYSRNTAVIEITF